MFDFYRKCEDSVKRKIINVYGKNLTEEQIKSLIEKEYVNVKLYRITTLNDTFDYLIEKMLDDLLNKQGYKELVLDEQTTLKISIGHTLKHILVNFYKLNLAEYFNYKPKIDKSVAIDIDYFSDINQIFDNVVDNHVFKDDINDLLQVDEISSFVSKTIYNDMTNYFDDIMKQKDQNNQSYYKLTREKDSE